MVESSTSHESSTSTDAPGLDSAEPRFTLRDWPRGWAPDAFLLYVSAVVCALTSVRIAQRLAIGPGWDTYAFLDNAAAMAGRSVGYIEPHRPPLLAFLTSILLRVGVWNVGSIQVLDGVLSAAGAIGFYLLLRRRFERPLAAIASVLLIASPALWAWLGTGYTDFPSVALSIWGVLLAVKATEDDPRWYWAALPMLMLAVLMRFGALLMVFPVGLWFALRARPFRDAKHIAIGAALVVLSYAPAGYYFFRYFNDPLFPFSFANNVAGAGLPGGAAAKPHANTILSLLSKLPGWTYLYNGAGWTFAGPFGWVPPTLFAITALGLLATGVLAVARQEPLWRRLVPFAGLLLIAITEFRGGTLLRVVAITLLGFLIATFYKGAPKPLPFMPERRSTWRANVKLDSRAALCLDATMLVWGLLFFDSHGHMATQIDRYFVTMLPATLYFIAMGWRTLGVPISALMWRIEQPHADASQVDWAARLNASSWLTSSVAVAVLGVIALSISVQLLAQISGVGSIGRDKQVLSAEKTAVWLRAHDAKLATRTIYSDLWPLTSWYLGMETFAMPTFESPKAFPHELAKNHADYYVIIHPHRYPGYKVVYYAGKKAPASVLKYDSTFPRALPAVAYFGDGWDAYLEQLCNFDFNLFFTSRRQVGTGTWMLDSMTPQQLSAYDAVAIFGTHWRSKGAAENILRQYVSNGGVVVIDASRNMDGFSYPLVDTVFMDVEIRRRAVPSSAEMTVAPELAAEARTPQGFQPTAFKDEGGGPWYGATYEPAPWAIAPGQLAERFQVLASVGGMPAVLLQRIGKGRIYWVSGNLMWHSYLEGDQNEVRLVRGVMRAAVGLPPTPIEEVAGTVKPWFVSRKLRPVPAPKRRPATATATGTVEPSPLASASLSTATASR